MMALRSDFILFFKLRDRFFLAKLREKKITHLSNWQIQINVDFDLSHDFENTITGNWLIIMNNVDKYM
jgi:hypothetical protein